MSKKLELSKPVQSEGVEVNSLEFREPVAEDLVVCGYPFRIYANSGTDVDAKTGETEMKIDTVVLASLAARLAGVPKSTIKRLCVKDFQAITGIISDFLE